MNWLKWLWPKSSPPRPAAPAKRIPASGRFLIGWAAACGCQGVIIPDSHELVSCTLLLRDLQRSNPATQFFLVTAPVRGKALTIAGNPRSVLWN